MHVLAGNVLQSSLYFTSHFIKKGEEFTTCNSLPCLVLLDVRLNELEFNYPREATTVDISARDGILQRRWGMDLGNLAVVTVG
ncbi:unnamed protein product [Cuscuta campestris]|uniref:Uncharacterized protein n=1 Tax=Cuscuta campestris TaxID=132261 RepID=A0A484KCH2_9ASTE|nr:unnamed protein product [Cuscuta campestris]